MKSALKLFSALFLISLLLVAVATAGSFEKNAFDGVNKSGEFRDRCLTDGFPVTIKRLDQNLYFVRVKNRYVGQVTAASYGEARDIACSKKHQPVLYNSYE